MKPRNILDMSYIFVLTMISIPLTVYANGWIDYIAAGNRVHVVFDGRCNDDTYCGNSRCDPLGNVKCNATYTVWFNNGTFSARGYNQHFRRDETGTADNASLQRGQLSIWEGIFTFDRYGKVSDDGRYGVVGYLEPEP